mmetsp:Transcript_22015/g.31634  ORF Transcript_22015/g.31634 Transcript_22015/m.31634 type:complete len:407 (+) Transcript_22015:17-1237(+)
MIFRCVFALSTVYTAYSFCGNRFVLPLLKVDDSSLNRCRPSTNRITQRSASDNPDNSYMDGNIMTLSRYLIEATRSNPDHADFESLIESIQIGCKTICNLLARSAVNYETDVGSSSLDNERSGKESDQSKRLYRKASKVLKNALKFTGNVGVLNFENEDPVIVEESWNSKYIAVFDPLDGSSNIDVGIVTGTIFGIFKEEEECLTDFDENVTSEVSVKLLKNLKLSNLVAAGYCMYSSSCVLMFSMGEGVNGFTLDPTIGEFILTHPNVKIPARGDTYSFNEARAPWWPQGLQDYVRDAKLGHGETGQTYTSRYIGSMVGDIHRTLLYGGVFGYPGDSKGAPDGKLRLIHEVGPMAFLVEQAGGKASTGKGRILEVQPTSLHQHVSTFLGSNDDIQEIENYLKKSA